MEEIKEEFENQDLETFRNLLKEKNILFYVVKRKI